MGLSNNTTPDMADTISVIHGKWTKRVPEGTEHATPRKLSKGQNEGATVWELGWPALENMTLKSAKLVKPEGFSSPQMEVMVVDADTGEEFLLAIQYDSKYLKTFIMCIPNLDPTRAFNLEFHMARNKTPTGDDKFNLRVIQDGKSLSTDYFLEWKKDASGKNVPHYYHDCPAPTQDELSGKWNFDAQNGFLCKYLENYMKEFTAPPRADGRPNLPANASYVDEESPAADKGVPADLDEYENDIPF